MTITARSGTSPRPRGARRICVLIVAALAFLSQSIALQTHVHPRLDGAARLAVAASAAGTDLRTVSPERNRAPADPATCPFCQDLAQAGAVLLPTPAALTPPAPPVSLHLPTSPNAARTSTRSHRWRSRAPPPLLA